MKVIKHSETKHSYWRDGVRTLVWAADTNGAEDMLMFEQFCDVDYGAPIHWHPVEEHLTFYRGRAEVTVDEETAIVEGPTTVIVPPRSRHGFRNLGPDQLHVIIAMANGVFEGFYDQDPEGVWRAFEGKNISEKRLVPLGKAYQAVARRE
jgi:mannose-6-phosphate isomerase-like protein (cupin superfamily)